MKAVAELVAAKHPVDENSITIPVVKGTGDCIQLAPTVELAGKA